VRELLLDLVLPETDRGVLIQLIVAIVVWSTALWMVRTKDRDIRHFVLGLAVANAAWFAWRTVH